MIPNVPPGPGPFPAMLDLWGMGGGLYEYRSALFASRGFASLSLAFLGHKDLPGPLNRINVGDRYFKVKGMQSEHDAAICISFHSMAMFHFCVKHIHILIDNVISP